jgi:mercuric ion binding protein
MSVIPSVIEYLHYLKKNKVYTTLKFKVWGNCGKCKTRIENALKVEGVKKAEWNMNTKMLTVTFKHKVISIEQIHENIASVGHDTEELYTRKKEFQKLPECCKYKRE